MDVIKPWVATRATELLGFEDEVLINFIYGMLEEKVGAQCESPGHHISMQVSSTSLPWCKDILWWMCGCVLFWHKLFHSIELMHFYFLYPVSQNVDGKHVQIQLTGFMEKNTGKFMKELWSLLISAQSNVSGIPQQFLDQKAEETRLKKVMSLGRRLLHLRLSQTSGLG